MMKLAFCLILIFASISCLAEKKIQPETVLRAVQVGATEARLTKIFGLPYFDGGGPDSDRSRSYEVSGPALKALQEPEGDWGFGHVVFERDAQVRTFRLVYAQFELSDERLSAVEKILREVGYIESGSTKLTGCWSSPSGRVAIVGGKKSVGGHLIFIMEASPEYLKDLGMTGNWMKPSYSDSCPQLRSRQSTDSQK